MKSRTRLPFEPLRTAAAAPSVDALAARVGVARRTIHRWARDGVPIPQADEAAIAIGSHPAYLWPDHWNQP